MFSNIVVGTDGSETARRAVELASELAAQCDATLHLVNAYRVSQTAPLDDRQTMALVLQEGSEKVLADAAATTKAIKVESHSVPGAPADVVIDVAQKVGADLIVVGSWGMQGLRRMIGSIPNSIAHSAPCHVLIAKTG